MNDATISIDAPGIQSEVAHLIANKGGMSDTSKKYSDFYAVILDFR